MKSNTFLKNRIRKIIITIFFTTFLFSVNTFAQTEIFGFGGYMMTTSVPVRKGDLQVKDVPNYGLRADIQIERGL